VEITVKTTIVKTLSNGLGSGERSYTPEMTRKMFSWTKYGGANYGLVQEDKTPEWYCQACREKQGSEMPSYMFEFSENEFIRICSLCQARKIFNHIKDLAELIAFVRVKLAPWY
jgi:hypothetical protein